jgi:signal transduction histidine kinase
MPDVRKRRYAFESLFAAPPLKLSGKNLLSLINDILDLSKIEAGKITIEPVEFILHNCIKDVALMQKSVIFGKGLTLELEVPEDIPQFMMGDQLRVKQILHNLMGNAVKFTSQGGITISVQNSLNGRMLLCLFR